MTRHSLKTVALFVTLTILETGFIWMFVHNARGMR